MDYTNSLDDDTVICTVLLDHIPGHLGISPPYLALSVPQHMYLCNLDSSDVGVVY